jgi:hypothetical protein
VENAILDLWQILSRWCCDLTQGPNQPGYASQLSSFVILQLLFCFQVLNGLERHVTPSLTEAPLDIDGLRLYIILLEYEMFTVAERYKTLAVPLAKKLLSLHQSHKTIIGQCASPEHQISMPVKSTAFTKSVAFFFEKNLVHNLNPHYP